MHEEAFPAGHGYDLERAQRGVVVENIQKYHIVLMFRITVLQPHAIWPS